MCGFLGIFGSSSEASQGDLLHRLERTLTHRGPDDFQSITGSGFQLLAWRLSIVDRSDARQPMCSADERVTVLYNGEIYNFLALRSHLEQLGVQFRTRSDTEVILAAYEVWGTSCFDRFEGMFAVCVMDSRRQRIVLARDRLGVKPLYFHEGADTLAVASEPKALLAVPGIDPALDHGAFARYLVFQTVLGSATLFKGVRKVPAGHVFEFSFTSCLPLAMTAIRPSSVPPPPSNYADAVARARATILEQVRLSFQTDLPVSAHLSGGFDSNLLVALHRSLYPDRELICVSSLIEGKSDKEWEFIQRAADYHDYPSATVTVNPSTFFSALDDVIFYLDEPVGDPGVVAQFLVNEYCAKQGKIVISGQGLDEMFFGYIRNLAAYLWSELGPEAIDPKSARFDSLPAHTRGFFQGWESYVASMVTPPGMSPTWGYFRKLCRFDPYGPRSRGRRGLVAHLCSLVGDTYARLLDRNDDLGRFMLAAETELQLPALLHMEDRASMRHSIESRVPFCTSSILDLAQSLDIRWKLGNGRPKGILRDAFKDIVPPHIADRTEKVGRPIPLSRWLREPSGNQLREQLQSHRELFLDLTGLDLVEWAQTTDPYDRLTWALLSLSSWVRLFRVAV